MTAQEIIDYLTDLVTTGIIAPDREVHYYTSEAIQAITMYTIKYQGTDVTEIHIETLEEI